MDVLAITLLVMSLAVGDSITPIAIAIYLASTRDPQRRLAGYLSMPLECCRVNLSGGLLLVLGPVRVAARRRRGVALRACSTGVPALLIGLLVILLPMGWVKRRRWTRVRLPEWALRTESSFGLGASVTALDLLTAFPYFGAIGAIVPRTGARLPSAVPGSAEVLTLPAGIALVVRGANGLTGSYQSSLKLQD